VLFFVTNRILLWKGVLFLEYAVKKLLLFSLYAGVSFSLFDSLDRTAIKNVKDDY